MRHDVRPCVDYNWRENVQNENERDEADRNFLEETESFLDAKNETGSNEWIKFQSRSSALVLHGDGQVFWVNHEVLGAEL